MELKFNPKQLYEAYKTWVCNNPNMVTDMETVVTWSSYFIAGKVIKSPIGSELIYSTSKLLSLLNDSLIREAYNKENLSYGIRYKLKLALTVMHYCEVLVELVVKQKWGSTGKWWVATVIQVVKCCSSLTLLYKYKDLPVLHPPISVLQRKKFIEKNNVDEDANTSFKLRRSGRVIRRVEGAPPLALRDWQPIISNKETTSNINISNLMYAETLHIVKPLIHLTSMAIFKTKSWEQWLISLILDLMSLKLYGKHLTSLSQEEKVEVSRRKLGLILYLLRSPVYNKYSKFAIENVLTSMSKNVPMAGIICNPILQYMSYWQDIYFYMWAT